MDQPQQDVLRFRPKARIIRTIGDQLISGAEAALIELVKNSYDADANYVAIKFHPPLVPGSGRISITDDGHGMSLGDIESKWMEPATSSKTSSRLSSLKSRKMMGSKGIGRFAAAKLGNKMSLTSTKETDRGKIAVLLPELDWSIFSEDAYLADIGIDYIQQSADGPTGTTIEVTDLNEVWTKAKIEKLHVELRRLLSPFSVASEDEDGFQVFLDLSECTVENCGFIGSDIVQSAEVVNQQTSSDDQTYRVRPFPLLTACDYELSGRFDSRGAFKGTFTIHRAGRAPDEVELDEIGLDDAESPNGFEVDLYLFDREAEALKGNMKAAGLGEMTAKQAREFLDSISGVAIYRGGFRVRPYGDPENDWLTLDSRRVQDPSLRIGRNQVAGYIKIQDEQNSNLVEKSSREGFEDNPAFQNLTRLLKRLLSEVVEPKRYQFRTTSGLSRKKTSSFEELKELSELKKIRQLIHLLAPKEREQAEAVIDAESSRLSQRIDTMQERQRVLEAKSSLGEILAEVLHEGSPEATFIKRTSDRLNLLLKSLFGGDEVAKSHAKEEYARKLPLLLRSGEKLSELFMNLRPLAGGKRGSPIYFHPLDKIRGTTELFDLHSVEFDLRTNSPGLELLGYPSDLATAILNLVRNSIHWMEQAKTPKPQISIVVSYGDGSAHISVHDNGPGVPAEFVESIFDIRFSLKDDGTGLGLSIAQEALARSGAKLVFHPENELGALFEIIFPAGDYHES